MSLLVWAGGWAVVVACGVYVAVGACRTRRWVRARGTGFRLGDPGSPRFQEWMRESEIR